MNAAGLMAVWEKVSDAPDAVGRLRRFVRDLAIAGRLIPPATTQHNPSLDRRWSSTADGPYSLPESWLWKRADAISDMRLGKMLDKAKNRGEACRYLRNVNVRWFDFDLSDVSEMLLEDAERAEFSLRDGDVLVCEGGEPGRAAVWDGREAGICFQKAIHRLRVHPNVNPWFLVHVLRQAADTGRLSKSFTGTGIKHLTGKGLAAFLIPLPPLSEQHRIVAKVDELMALCDRLEAARAEREKRRDRLVTATIIRLAVPSRDVDAQATRSQACFAIDAIPHLTARADNLRQVRLAIRNLAIRGLLVSTREDEDAGAVMRTHNGCNTPPPTDVVAGKAPYTIPPNWRWTTYGDLTLHSDAGWSPKTEEYPRQLPAWGVLKVSAVSWDVFRPSENKQIHTGTEPRAQAVVRKDDFLISRANTAELVARAVIVDVEPENLMMSDKIVRLHLKGDCDPRYLLLVNNYAMYARSYFATEASGASASMKNVSRSVIMNLPIPLPPLTEQHRIVAKVTELMTLCDHLEASLVAGAETRRALLEATLRDALAPALHSVEANAA